MNNLKKAQTGGNVDSPTAKEAAIAPVRPYVRPQILSAEGLEAVAATCDPPVGSYGKTFNPATLACATLGS